MKLSLNLILSELNREDLQADVPAADTQKFTSVRILQQASDADNREILYIVDCEPMQESRRDLSAYTYLYLTKNKKPVVHAANVLPVITAQPAYIVENAILDIFQYYNDWDKQLQDTLNQGADLQKLLDLSYPIFKNAIYMVDSSFKVLALTDIPEMREMGAAWKFLAERGYVDISTVSGMNQYHELEELEQATTPIFYESRMFYNPFISSNIYVNHIFQGRLFIVGMLSRFRDQDLELAAHLTSVLSVALQQLSSFRLSSGRFFEHYLLDILSGELTDKRTIIEQLPGLQLPSDDEYCVVYIPTDKDGLVSIQSILYGMERTFPCRCVLLNHAVVGVIVQETLSQFGSLYDSLTVFLNSINKKGSISVPFTDFSQLRDFYQQTIMLFQAGNKHSHQSLYAPEELAVLCWGSYCDSIQQYQLLRHPACEFLISYDYQNGTEYYRTLYIYLSQERRQTETAQKLYIHRNTLIKRLSKIDNLLHLDLENPNTRLWLLLSFTMKE